ncbi:MAG: photosynthetic reaction center subunit M [Chloroflexaceae bacterium]|nr:photosynthetic reaction center subunit M [Chloroflexaceae bacterium]
MSELVYPPNRQDTGPELDIGGPGGRIGKPVYWRWLERWTGFDAQFGPFYMGLWGILAFFFGGMFTFIWLVTMLRQVDYNGLAFLKYFAVLQLNPPRNEYGLGWPPMDEGGWWLVATFFLTLSILAWEVRLWLRAREWGLRPYLAYGFTGAIILYLAIYVIRPIVMGTWAEAPAHGIRALLDWTNNVSVAYGNFYYNPFHMLSIFFLLGSTLLFSMHGATIWALEKYGAHEEEDEIEAPGTGTERAQLFWRWTMGFNANAYSIHLWAFWFAWLCGFTGAIGVLLSGTLVFDWFQWAIEAQINYPQVAPPPVVVPFQ